MATTTPALASAAYKAQIRTIAALPVSFTIRKSGSNVEAINAATGVISSTNTDLSVVIEAIIDNSVCIYIAPGSYNLDTPCNIASKDDWMIVGAGKGTKLTQTYTTADANGTWEDGFRIDACNDFSLRDFFIDGNGLNQFQGWPNSGSDDDGSCIHLLNTVMIDQCLHCTSPANGTAGTYRVRRRNICGC